MTVTGYESVSWEPSPSTLAGARSLFTNRGLGEPFGHENGYPPPPPPTPYPSKPRDYVESASYIIVGSCRSQELVCNQ